MKWLVLLLGACGASQPASTIPGPIVTHEVVRACLTEEPPQPRTVKISGPSDGCPTQFAACFTVDDTRELLLTLQELKDWTNRAWGACQIAEEKTNEKSNP
jgi:hypothetical protein